MTPTLGKLPIDRALGLLHRGTPILGRFQDASMAAIFIFLAVLIGASAAVFNTAHSQLYYGTSWASGVCGTSTLFCNHSEYLAYGAGVCLIVGIGFGIGRALSG